MVEFMQQGSTLSSQVYFKILKKLCKVVQNKRRGILTCGIVVLHNNACPHTRTAGTFQLEVV
jgi:hypothetical protein